MIKALWAQVKRPLMMAVAVVLVLLGREYLLRKKKSPHDLPANDGEVVNEAIRRRRAADDELVRDATLPPARRLRRALDIAREIMDERDGGAG